MMLRAYGSLRDSAGSHANVVINSLISRLDGATVLRTSVVPDDATLLVQWGFKKTTALASAIDAKIPFVIIDLGYFDEYRLDRFSVSINGLHGLSMPLHGVHDWPARPHPRIQAWREGGDTVVIVGQMPGDAALRGLNVDAWMHKTAQEAVAAFGKPALKRVHPKMLNDWEPPLPSLDTTFDDTYVYVTYTSTAAVQTVLAGCHTIAQHPASSAFGITPNRMTRLSMPGRAAWAHELSHREYSMTDSDDLDAAAEYIIKGFEQGLGPAALGNVDTKGMRP